MSIRIINTVLIGILAGIVGGALGQSATFIMIPGLLLLGVIKDFKVAVGTVLCALLPPISIGAATHYYNKNKVDISVAVILAITYFISATYAAQLNERFSRKALMNATAGLLAVSTLYFLYMANM